MSKARDSIEDLKTIDANLAAKAPLASPVFTGNVGVGSTLLTTTASNMLQLGSTSNLAWYNQNDDELDISVNAVNNSGNKYIEAKAASQYIQYAGTHTFKVASSGSAGAAITWNTGLEVVASGKARAKNGLLFGTDTAAANTLDDYEEGTWTPADIGGGTLTVLDSRYTKIGRLVHLTSYIQFTGIGSSGSTVQLNGLPFAVITNSGQVVGNVMCNLVTRNVAAFNAATYMSSTTLKFYQSCDNSGWQPFRHVANISVNDIIYFNATYFTDA